MKKIKTLGAAVLLVATVAAPVFAQDGGGIGGRYGWEPTNSAESERPRPDFGMLNSETTEPGDFAVTDGLSGRSPIRELHGPCRSRHQQRPVWELRRRVTARSTLNEGPRRYRGPFNCRSTTWLKASKLFSGSA